MKLTKGQVWTFSFLIGAFVIGTCHGLDNMFRQLAVWLHWHGSYYVYKSMEVVTFLCGGFFFALLDEKNRMTRVFIGGLAIALILTVLPMLSYQTWVMDTHQANGINLAELWRRAISSACLLTVAATFGGWLVIWKTNKAAGIQLEESE